MKRRKVKKMTHKRLRPAEAAKYLHIGESTLAAMRTSGDGPDFIKLGGRIFYDTRDLERWINSNKFKSTADYATAR